MSHTSKTSYGYQVHVSGAKSTCRPIPNAQKMHKFGVLLLLSHSHLCVCSALM